ncbi:hypothetical protein [Virgisporangium aurantiacum]|uniref:Uncharacterized protein n=1 Tax=Virgisporangium aurantiacum TaxID=175570 RepID=A0A8J3Z7K3_9ACTN|nr:hypothetical protein [Virgisporangium aurantiacum]GIJ58487.1 hypothetical protein Vau01_060030 [Virgisporangium aurantiacum]
MGTEALFDGADAYTSLAEVAALEGTPDNAVASTFTVIVFTVGMSTGVTISETYEHGC